MELIKDSCCFHLIFVFLVQDIYFQIPYRNLLYHFTEGITFSCPSSSQLLLKEVKKILPRIIIQVVLQSLGEEKRKKNVHIFK